MIIGLWSLIKFQNDIFVHAQEIERGFALILKCSWGNFVHGAKVLSLNTSNGSGIVKNFALLFESYRSKKFSPAETNEISEFRWRYRTNHKTISPKYIALGFSLDMLQRFRLPTTPNLALYQFVSGFAKFWHWFPGL